MIVVSKITKSFGSRLVLDDISFEARPGESLFILGKSGVGKSVLLKLIVGLIASDQGSISVGGQKVDVENPRLLAQVRRKCGLVFQFPALLDSATVFENIAFGLRARGLVEDPNLIEPRVIEQMRTVDLDTSFLNSYPNQLSYVAQKKVSIARTLAVSPDYLLFDEPTTGMDPVATAVLNELLKKLKRELNVTTIVVSHDIKSALACADRLILIDHGKIVFDGEPKNFKSSNVPLAIDFREGVSLGK